MRISYDSEADALAVVFREDSTLEDSVDLEEGVTIDLDGHGHIIGLEILDARRRLGHKALTTLAIDHLPLTFLTLDQAKEEPGALP